MRRERKSSEEGGKNSLFPPFPLFQNRKKNSQGPFCRAFPEARAWVAPQQWSWPINLPVQFFGIFPEGRLTEEAADPSSEAAVPWLREIDHKPFASSVGIGPYSEVAFYHKKSRTLLVTDAVVQVPRTAPLVVEEEALLEAGGPRGWWKGLLVAIVGDAIYALQGGESQAEIAEGAIGESCHGKRGASSAWSCCSFTRFQTLRPWSAIFSLIFKTGTHSPL